MMNRRELLKTGAAGLMLGSLPLNAQTHNPSKLVSGTEQPVESKIDPVKIENIVTTNNSVVHCPVVTPNGRTLAYKLNNGVKEFHLIAEEIEHEFAPGNRVKAWGYNGSTPGPTIEVVEGDHVRIFVTNQLKEHTTVHWHGLLVPWGMDGIGGLTQPAIQPDETYVYEFTLKQNGTFMYHPHADEMVQMAMGMMGFFIVHPKENHSPNVDRDYAIMLHNWAVHPGTYRPDPSVMTEFDLWTMNSKVFPAINFLPAQTGERVRIRFANISMWNHPMHLHGVIFEVTGSEGGRWPRQQWRREVTEVVGVGQTRDIEFIAVEGDWALHCHMSHHTMNAMAHNIPNLIGVEQPDEKLNSALPNYMSMGKNGMAEHQDMSAMGGPENTLPMMMGQGRFGNLEMGGMFTLVQVRNKFNKHPPLFDGSQTQSAKRVSSAPKDLPR